MLSHLTGSLLLRVSYLLMEGPPGTRPISAACLESPWGLLTLWAASRQDKGALQDRPEWGRC